MKKPTIFLFCSFLLSHVLFAQSEESDSEIETDTLSEIVITTLLHPENINTAPASVRLISQRDIDRFAGSNIGELISTLQGVEFMRYGVDGTTFNARGLNSAFNNKVLQLVDGRISTSALSGGLPVFNNGSTIKDDIDRIEVVLGPQTALYGPNAHNGVFNILTKDPQIYPGTSVSLSAGSQYQFSGRVRHATRINDRWSFKITGEYATGREFDFVDSVYVSPVAKGIPEYNPDFDFRHLRSEAHLQYNLDQESKISVTGGTSTHDFLQVTTSGRNQMRGIVYSFLQAQLKTNHFYVNLYNTWGSLGKSYILSPYTQVFNNLTQPGPQNMPPAMAENVAYNAARISEKSRRFNADFKYNYEFLEPGLFVVAGLDYENSQPNTDGGNTLVGDAGEISISQIGAVLQLEKTLPSEMRFIGALRYDKNDNFDDLWAPKFLLVKNLDEGNIRVGWARAYSRPSIQNQYASVQNFLFGNGGNGITYIANNANINDPNAIRITDPLKVEQVSTWEAGIKNYLFNSLWIDLNAYYGSSKNFITPPLMNGGRALSLNDIEVAHNPNFAGTVTNDTLRGATFFTFKNYGKAKVYGLDLGVSYNVNSNFNLALRYSWTDGKFEDNDANNDGTISKDEESINAPKHRGFAQMTWDDFLLNKLSLSIGARFVEEYDFYSGTQVGSSEGKGTRVAPKNFNYGPLGGFTSFNLGSQYQINNNILFNLNITNLFNTEQREFVGSPSIGRLMMAGITITD